MCTLVAGLLRGGGWEGVHLQRAQADRALGNLPAASYTLRGEVRAGKRSDNSGLKQGQLDMGKRERVGGVRAKKKILRCSGVVTNFVGSHDCFCVYLGSVTSSEISL